MKKLLIFICVNIIFLCYVIVALADAVLLVATVITPIINIFVTTSIHWGEFLMYSIFALGTFPALLFSVDKVIECVQIVWNFKIVYNK